VSGERKKLKRIVAMGTESRDGRPGKDYRTGDSFCEWFEGAGNAGKQAKELLQGFAVSRRWENKDGLDAGGERSYFCLWRKHGDPNSQPLGHQRCIYPV
jgi:hypothetical protein